MDLLTCPACPDERALVVPDCEDGHGEDCPDLVCELCGAAFSTGLVLPVAVGAGRPAAAVAAAA